MRRWLGALLLVLGVLMLVYRGFSNVEEKHEARIAGFRMGIEQRERVEIPVWVGVIVTLAGGVLLATGAGSGRRES